MCSCGASGRPLAAVLAEGLVALCAGLAAHLPEQPRGERPGGADPERDACALVALAAGLTLRSLSEPGDSRPY
jgi:hypothetical protein